MNSSASQLLAGGVLRLKRRVDHNLVPSTLGMAVSSADHGVGVGEQAVTVVQEDMAGVANLAGLALAIQPCIGIGP
jgi:hypothetical protein